MSTDGHKWKPLKPAPYSDTPSPEIVKAAMEGMGVDEATAIKRLNEDHDRCEYWINDLYQVEVRRSEAQDVWLCIRRRDGYVGRNWRHFQLIKNQLLGPECEAVELYPAESRLVDTSNKYHLFGCSDPTFRFPFGYRFRDVQNGDSKVPGLRQAAPLKHAKGG